MNAAPWHFRVGNFKCIAIRDGGHLGSADFIFCNAREQEVAQALRTHGLEADQLKSSWTCLLVDTGEKTLLVDTGIGIPAHDLPRLCEPFVQVDTSLGRRFEGTGLGLAQVLWQRRFQQPERNPVQQQRQHQIRKSIRMRQGNDAHVGPVASQAH